MAYKPKPQTVSEGGSGVTSFTAYAPLCAGTTNTGALQSVASLGNSGDVLTSNGASALPSFQPYSGGSGKGLVWAVQTTSISPTDSTTYYIYMQNITTSSTIAGTRFLVPTACTINRVYGGVNSSTGSSENSTLEFFVNDTTSTTITSTLQLTSSVVTFNNTGLSISLSAGDNFQIRWITPAWVTNPSLVSFTLSIQAT